ncbi:choice-of-anchor B family protein [Glaciecola petra]|uniref:Choice-of-anchor B family protein n=1 Tax=Glaciecola petra TaxID=3075602 RepID=A0ABU2ZU08_9ALTE|nr:choice-of-anchor B family protein [Aestuariibacter sp. P117]MDT0596127.1 choice-of-anchor B family protein [Aestuariibacter sp. P117]
MQFHKTECSQAVSVCNRWLTQLFTLVFTKHLLAASVFIMTLSVTLSQVLLLQKAQAHSEEENARFVSVNGSDQGDCKNRFRPCKTIGFAARRANKGDKILVAMGLYEVSSDEELSYLISEINPVLAGFNTLDNYQQQSPDQFITTLTAVPKQYLQTLYSKGFTVIQDTKGFGARSIDETVIESRIRASQQAETAQTSSECIDGEAAGFSCRNVDLLGRVPISQISSSATRANDVWGHVDLNNMREYAILGIRDAVSVIDVTDPENPVVVGRVEGQATIWRDIKVVQFYNEEIQQFQSYAISGADAVSEGLTILDLNNLPNEVTLVERDLIDGEASHNVYISNVNYTTNTSLNNTRPFLHVMGGASLGGSLRTFLIENPPSLLRAYNDQGANRQDYAHDASSLPISDARAQTDCGEDPGETCNVIIDFNENEMRLWDHTRSNSAVELSRSTYPNADYVHSGWWTEDKQFVYVHDELDETTFRLNTTINIFNISDLRNPFLANTWTGPTRAVDHNGFVRGNKYYMSNYERGLTILDISDPVNPSEAGFFDTVTGSNNAVFNGAWGAYPFLPSGIILVSDIAGGLYIFKDNTISADQDAVGFIETSLTIPENSLANIPVKKQGNGAQTIDYEVLLLSADASDVEVKKGQLSWAANDSDDQSIFLEILGDNIVEGDEKFAVILSNPQGGSLYNGKSNAFITISGTAPRTGRISFETNELTLLENQDSVNVELNRLGGSEQTINVNYVVQSVSADEQADFTLTTLTQGQFSWSEGDTSSRSIGINLIDDELSESLESFRIVLLSDNQALLGQFSVLEVNIKDDDSNQAPIVDAGSDIQVNTRQTVQLSTANVSDEDETLSLVWEQIAGTNVTLDAPNSLQISFVAPSQSGNIELRLTATDEFGVSASDTIGISVVAPVVTPPPASVENASGGGGLNLGLFLLLPLIYFRRFKW